MEGRLTHFVEQWGELTQNKCVFYRPKRFNDPVNSPPCLSIVQIVFSQSSSPLLYPLHTLVYSFCFSVRPFVCSLVRTFVRSFVFPSQGQSFCVKIYKTSYFEDPLMDFIHIWHDGRYRSKVFISTIPTPGVTFGSRSRT